MRAGVYWIPLFHILEIPAGSEPTGGWHAPDAQRSSTLSLEFAQPVEFDILKLHGMSSRSLLYAQAWVDGRLNPMFHSHFPSGGGDDGQVLIILYRRLRGRSLRMTIPPPDAPNTSAMTGVQFYQRALQHPLRSFHPQAAARL